MLCAPVGYSSNYQKPRKIFVEQGGLADFSASDGLFHTFSLIPLASESGQTEHQKEYNTKI